MTHLNQQQSAALKAHIKDLETRTDGEIVTLITAHSDSYEIPCMLYSLPLILLLPLILQHGWEPWSPVSILTLQLLTVASSWLIAQWPTMWRILIPKRILHRRASAYAHQLFMMQNLHCKTQRNAILLFVSVAEKYVEIIADKGIDQYVEDHQWQAIISGFGSRVRSGDIFAGYQFAIDACAEHLVAHFPVSNEGRDELSNELIKAPATSSHLLDWQ